MNQQQQIIQTMLATPVKGFVAKRFFHVTAPERHAENVLAKLAPDEKFYSFILLPNSKKQTVEALICTNRRVIVWHNEFAEDEEIALGQIETIKLEKGWFSGSLYLVLTGETQARKFKCETEIIAAFEQALLEAKEQASV